MRGSLRGVGLVIEGALAVIAFALIAAFGIGGQLLHVGVSPVLTGSMEPTFAPGDAVITRPVDVQSLRPGDIAVFVPPGETQPYAHRITSIAYENGQPVLTTRGDANPAPDAWHATLQQQQVRKVVADVPWVGHALTQVDAPWLRAIAIALLGTVITGIGTAAILRTPGTHRRRTPTPVH